MSRRCLSVTKDRFSYLPTIISDLEESASTTIDIPLIMESLRAEIATATGEQGREKQNIGVAVLMAGNKSGAFLEETHGFKHLAQDSVPVDFNSTFWVASCTKLMTTVATLQIVERGLVDLDEDITRVLHEWKDATVLTGFDDNGKPITKPTKNKMTLRQLLTHSSGISYDFMSPVIQKYREAVGLPALAPAGQTLAETSVVPLLYEPGEGWAYSYSIDWAGVVVERLGGYGRLEDYMSKNIWEPLGMTATSFRPKDREDIRSNLVEMLTRDETGQLKVEPNLSTKPRTYEYDAGGSGLYTKPSDYTKLLASLLRNNGLVLRKETVDMMFTPQLPDPKYLRAALKDIPYPFVYTMLHAHPQDLQWNCGFGGILNMEDIPGKRKKGTLCWTGLPNLLWWIDPTSNIYGMYATQIVPFGDVPTTDVFSHFEEAIYKEFAQK
ncbi:hypothetical protein D9758_014592 [Tetrapyrgos nigripes]|uniref:Beta-lactamase-related domain-containing protein n=1 Tax=Tetrapyrgos nigripes TaxID=182062 RepID=A0A8H5BZE2_9AGAR|nr:hypothetical protein D9758_014592 [Tetrapyrgos nigripes]